MEKTLILIKPDAVEGENVIDKVRKIKWSN